MNPTVLALGCHPDDIEFMMAGTLFLLREAGCTLHYLNVANGSCGSTEHGPEQIARIRRGEAVAATRLLGAAYHESLTADLDVFYAQPLIRKVTGVVREVKPDILLLLSPEDYMEDHMNACRVGVTAAFCRGMPNYATDPPRAPTFQDVVLYHALPYGLHDGLRRRIVPEVVVDITSVIDDKERMLACHGSQKRWLDESQGLDSYLITMRDMSAEVAKTHGPGDRAPGRPGPGRPFEFAEGWRRHSHLGYAARETDPLGEILGEHCWPTAAGRDRGIPRHERA
jgi:LmbE family N-acetylglucosaminyl deacetylase